MPEKFFLQISVCFLLSNDPQNITTKQLLLTVYGSKVIAVPARGPSVAETPLNLLALIEKRLGLASLDWLVCRFAPFDEISDGVDRRTNWIG